MAVTDETTSHLADLEPQSARRPSVPPATRDHREFPQKRARATYDALLEAALDCFAQRGFDATQTADIARAAGVSVGTFYRYFTDKRQAFVEMMQAHLDRAWSAVSTRMTPEAFSTTTPAGRRAAIEHVLDVLFAHAATHPDLHRVFLEMSLRDDDVRRIRREFEERGRDAIAALVAHLVTRERIPDPVAAASVIQIAAEDVAIATVGGRVAFAVDQGEARALREALSVMIYRYVFGE